MKRKSDHKGLFGGLTFSNGMIVVGLMLAAGAIIGLVVSGKNLKKEQAASTEPPLRAIHIKPEITQVKREEPVSEADKKVLMSPAMLRQMSQLEERLGTLENQIRSLSKSNLDLAEKMDTSGIDTRIEALEDSLQNFTASIDQRIKQNEARTRSTNGPLPSMAELTPEERRLLPPPFKTDSPQDVSNSDQTRAREEAQRKLAMERARIAREQAEQAQLEQARLEQERLEQARLEKIRQEKERLERARIAREKAEKEEAERLAKIKAEKEEAKRLAAEKAAREKAEKERLARLKAEQERLAAEKRAKEEAERLAAERREAERLAALRIAEEKRKREAEARIAKLKAEQERLLKEKAELERVAKKKAEEERLAREKLEREKLAEEKRAKERAEAEKLAREKLEQEKLAREKRAREETERARMAQLKEEREKAAREQEARARAAQAKKEKELMAKAEKLKKQKKEVAEKSAPSFLDKLKNAVAPDTASKTADAPKADPQTTATVKQTVQPAQKQAGKTGWEPVVTYHNQQKAVKVASVQKKPAAKKASNIVTGSVQKPRSKPKTPAKSASKGPIAVHIGSASNIYTIKDSWLTLRRDNGILHSLKPYILAADGKDSTQVPFRLLAGPVKSADEAQRICTRLNAKGSYCRSTKLTGHPLKF